MSLLEKLKAGTKNEKRVKFPGTETEVDIRLLSDSDLQAAHFAAERLFRKEDIGYHVGTVDAYESEKTTQILFRALEDPETGKPVAANIDAMRKLITRDEKDFLVGEYAALEAECSPAVESEAELAALVEDVKKNPDSAGSVSSISMLRRLSTSLARELQSLRTASGSMSG